MAGRRAVELAMRAALEAICRPRSEPARRVDRVRILLADPKDSSFFAGVPLGCTIRRPNIAPSGHHEAET
jgi:hypothetical protein